MFQWPYFESITFHSFLRHAVHITMSGYSPLFSWNLSFKSSFQTSSHSLYLWTPYLTIELGPYWLWTLSGISILSFSTIVRVPVFHELGLAISHFRLSDCSSVRKEGFLYLHQLFNYYSSVKLYFCVLLPPYTF